MDSRYYSFDPDDGLSLHATAEEAEKQATDFLRTCLGTGEDWPEGEWHPSAAHIQWGRLVPLGVSATREGTTYDGDPCIEYHIAPQPDELEQLRAERDAAVARAAEAERRRYEVTDALGAALAERDEALARVEAERDQLKARIAELGAQEVIRLEALRELAPPVVPEGWTVVQRDGEWHLLLLSSGEPCTWAADVSRGLVAVSPYVAVTPEPLAALLYAHRTGKCPPLAGDKP